MQKTCHAVADTIQNKKILDQNQEHIQELNLQIKSTEDNINKESSELFKLNKFFDKSELELPNQLKAMQLA